jgi:uncharacterized delta-60 repeat protein
VRREAKRHAALEVHSATESGVAAALCHRSPKRCRDKANPTALPRRLPRQSATGQKIIEGFRLPIPHDGLKGHHAMKELFSIRTIIFASTLLLQLGTLCFHARGAAGDVDLSFDPGSGVNGPIKAVVVQPDGKVLIGGKFTTVNGLSRTNLARLNADGSGDSSFNAGTAAAAWFNLYVLNLQADGKVLAGHDTGISRFHSDGSLDTNFNASLNAVCSDEYGCYLNVSSIAVQTDGKVLIAGTFIAGTGTNAVQSLARLNTDGTLDNTFVPAPGDYFNPVRAFQADGKVFLGYADRIERRHPDGSLDNSFGSGSGFTVVNGAVRSIAWQSNGNILIGGGFTTVKGVVRPSLARLYGDSVAPTLGIARSNALVIVSWPVTGSCFQLQETANLALPNSWSPVAQPAVTNAGQISVTVPTTVGRKFFRLNSS